MSKKTKQTIMITGASGYIGRHVVKEAIDKGFTVYVCDLQYNGVDSRALQKDVDIFDGTPDIFDKVGKPDILLHLAWQDGFVHNSPAHMLNVSKHYQFLRNMILGGCKNIAVMGSMHEVGYWEGAIDENTPCSPLSQYGVAKNALRQALLLLNNELDFNLYWLRAYYIYGDDSRANSIFAKIIQASEAGQKQFPFTNGKNKYDFISVYELAKLIVAAVTQTQITGIINVCSGKPISLAEQVERFIEEHNIDIKLNYGAFSDREYDSPEVYGDNKKIKWILQNE